MNKPLTRRGLFGGLWVVGVFGNTSPCCYPRGFLFPCEADKSMLTGSDLEISLRLGGFE
jgi:hypothetical protein